MPKPKVNKDGRGAAINPPNRFETLWTVRDPDREGPDDPIPGTLFLKDQAKSIIAYNDSPDVGFDAGINPYRGCEHGCVYCYARPSHEYLGFSSGYDFESKILVKSNASELLRKELMSPRWKPQVVALSGNTDCYQPGERKFQVTRKCLEVLLDFRNPVGIITKNFLITRDIDLLKELARYQAVAVFITITTLDESLSRILEPRASRPSQRLEVVKALSAAGIPVGVMVAPIIPAITDHEIPKLLKAAKKAGAQRAGYTIMRLPYQVKDLFSDWLDRHFPDRKQKVLNRLKSMRKGKLNNPEFGSRMGGSGVFAEQIHQMFSLAIQQEDFNQKQISLSTDSFRRPGQGRQLSFFP